MAPGNAPGRNRTTQERCPHVHRRNILWRWYERCGTTDACALAGKTLMPVIRTMASARALALGLLASAPPSARADVFIVTYEAATVQNTTVPLSDAGVETFDGQPVGTNETFTTNFGTGADPITITGTYTGAQISAATYYGGAGGTGNYAVTFSPQGYSLALSAINNS